MMYVLILIIKKRPIPHSQINKFSINNGFLLFNSRMYVPPNCYTQIMKIYHDSHTSGHYGISKTISLTFPDFLVAFFIFLYQKVCSIMQYLLSL